MKSLQSNHKSILSRPSPSPSRLKSCFPPSSKQVLLHPYLFPLFLLRFSSSPFPVRFSPSILRISFFSWRLFFRKVLQSPLLYIPNSLFSSIPNLCKLIDSLLEILVPPLGWLRNEIVSIGSISCNS